MRGESEMGSRQHDCHDTTADHSTWKGSAREQGLYMTTFGQVACAGYVSGVAACTAVLQAPRCGHWLAEEVSLQ